MKTVPLWVALALLLQSAAGAAVKPLETHAFELRYEMVLPGGPKEIFDAFTGDISGWWDHTFSEHPKALYIEPKPGGHFMEIFDDAGNGVVHATVTAAHRGKLLRFVGPLGLAGNAVEMVHTLEFSATEDGNTSLAVTVRGSGQMKKEWAEAVDHVWNHFLFERFKPYVEAGEHKTR